MQKVNREDINKIRAIYEEYITQLEGIYLTIKEIKDYYESLDKNQKIDTLSECFNELIKLTHIMLEQIGSEEILNKMNELIEKCEKESNDLKKDYEKIIDSNNDQIENLKYYYIQKLHNIDQEKIKIKKDNQDLQNKVNSYIENIKSLSQNLCDLKQENNKLRDELYKIDTTSSNINADLKKQINELMESKKNDDINYKEEILKKENKKLRDELYEIDEKSSNINADLKKQNSEILKENGIMHSALKEINKNYNILLERLKLQEPMAHAEYSIQFRDDNSAKEYANHSYIFMQSHNESFYDAKNLSRSYIILTNENNLEYAYIHSNKNIILAIDKNNSPTMEGDNAIGIENYNRYNGASEDQREDIEHSKSNNILISAIIVTAILSIMGGCCYMFNYHKSDIIEINHKTDSADTVISTL